MKLKTGRRFLSVIMASAIVISLSTFNASASSSNDIDCVATAEREGSFESIVYDDVEDLPDGGKIYVYKVDGVTHQFPLPPEDFDPISATDEQLKTYGIPPRPDINNEDDYLSWVEIVDGVNFVPMTELEVMRGNENKASSNNTRYETTTYSAVSYRTSPNWSGYVSNLGLSSSEFYTQVQVDYVEPTVKSSSGVCGNGVWIGLGGDGSKSLVQAGTAVALLNPNRHYAWFECLGPNHTNPPQTIKGIDVNPGDKIHIYISFQAANDLFNWYVVNSTTGQALSDTPKYDSDIYFDGSTVEWIVERPSGSTGYGELGNYGSVTFTNCKAMLNTSTSWINLEDLSNVSSLKMTSNGSSSGRTLSSPGSINGDTFTCYWYNYQ